MKTIKDYMMKLGFVFKEIFKAGPTLIKLLGITPKACYTLARIGSRSRRTSKVHSA